MADSTAITNIELAAASTIVSDFNKKIAGIRSISSSTSAKYDGIKNSIADISPVDFTPPAVFQITTDDAVNKAFESSAWLTAQDAGAKIQEIQTRCSFLEEIPLGGMVEKMRGGVLDDAVNAAGDAIQKAKDELGLSMPEFGIGKALSDIVNKGRAAYEAVEDSLSGAISDVLETGKAGLAKAQAVEDQIEAAVDTGKKMIQKGLAELGPGLRKLDEMINCMDAVGGGPVSSETDQMIDALNDVYAKAGVKDDPNQTSFGEFDDQAFFNSIPGITSDQKSNILKATNGYDKTKNNASKAVDKAKDMAESDTTPKSVSALVGGTPDSIASKKDDIKEKAEVKFDTPATPPIPAAPGRPEEPAKPAEETPAPAPAPVEAQNAFEKMAKSIPPDLFTWRGSIISIEPDETDMSQYLSYDPDRVNYPRFKTDLFLEIPLGGTEHAGDSLELIIVYSVPSALYEEPSKKSESFFGEDEKFKRWTATVEASLTKPGQPLGSGVTKTAEGVLEGFPVKESEFKPSPNPSPKGLGVAVSFAIRKINWTSAEIEGIL